MYILRSLFWKTDIKLLSQSRTDSCFGFITISLKIMTENKGKIIIL